MSSSTEKNTPIGRAVARVRDRYRDTYLAGATTATEALIYTYVRNALNEVKQEYWTVVEEEEEAAWAALEEEPLSVLRAVG